ncbi:hypothetical protein [Spirillospora sp. NPDC048819]|uniref:hypothetical protein n=1 Tax=Spirillospora sp. NPDC048819 TaxID=3155268 RepID=UPI0033DDACD0
MIPRKAILAGVVIAFLGKFLLIAFFGFMQDPETEPGAAATAFSWTLGTVVRAAGGYVAARMSVGSGRRSRVAGAGATAGAVGYALFLALMVTLAALGGNPGFRPVTFSGCPSGRLRPRSAVVSRWCCIESASRPRRRPPHGPTVDDAIYQLGLRALSRDSHDP